MFLSEKAPVNVSSILESLCKPAWDMPSSVVLSHCSERGMCVCSGDGDTLSLVLHGPTIFMKIFLKQ